GVLMNSQRPTPNFQRGATKSATVLFACFTVFANFVVGPSAHQLLARVVARVGTVAITQTDVDSAVAFGIVEPKTADGRDPVKYTLDRRLIVRAVNRVF